MITLFRTSGCRQCQEICEALKDLAIAHRIVSVDPASGRATGLPAGSSPPALKDNGSVYEGHAAIRQHLEELEGFVASWQKFQTDACYCDEEGNPE